MNLKLCLNNMCGNTGTDFTTFFDNSSSTSPFFTSKLILFSTKLIMYHFTSSSNIHYTSCVQAPNRLEVVTFWVSDPTDLTNRCAGVS